MFKLLGDENESLCLGDFEDMVSKNPCPIKRTLLRAWHEMNKMGAAKDEGSSSYRAVCDLLTLAQDDLQFSITFVGKVEQ